MRARGAGPGDSATRPGDMPSEVRRILIVGSGGFGREALNWALDAWPDRYHDFVGFLSDDPPGLPNAPSRLPILTTPSNYEPRSGDGFILAIGIPGIRRRVAETLQARGANFLTLVHPLAVVAPSASIGLGAVVCPFALISDRARVGNCTLLNYYSSLGHDATAGDFAVLSPYATLGGNAHIRDDVFMGLHSSVGPGRTVGSRCKISANSCALTDAPPESIIYGSPGRIGPLLH